MEASRELRKKEKLERELKEAKAQVEQKSIELKNLQQNVEKSKADFVRLENQNKDQRVTLDRTLKDLDVINARFVKLQHDFDTQVINNDALANENALKSQDLKVNRQQNFKKIYW